VQPLGERSRPELNRLMADAHRRRFDAVVVWRFSSFGKLIVFDMFLASAPLAIFEAIRGSRCWWVAVAASAVTLAEIYVHFSRVMT
jgi:hypothetical protein